MASPRPLFVFVALQSPIMLKISPSMGTTANKKPVIRLEIPSANAAIEYPFTLPEALSELFFCARFLHCLHMFVIIFGCTTAVGVNHGFIIKFGSAIFAIHNSPTRIYMLIFIIIYLFSTVNAIYKIIFYNKKQY